jgi:hypothetical protein
MTTNPTREELKSVMARYGARGAVWMVSGFTPGEMAALEALTGTPTGARLAECAVKHLEATQAADIFGVSTHTWLAKTRAGTAPPPVAIGQTQRWARETLCQWAAAGCPSGFVNAGNPVMNN